MLRQKRSKTQQRGPSTIGLCNNKNNSRKLSTRPISLLVRSKTVNKTNKRNLSSNTSNNITFPDTSLDLEVPEAFDDVDVRPENQSLEIVKNVLAQGHLDLNTGKFVTLQQSGTSTFFRYAVKEHQARLLNSDEKAELVDCLTSQGYNSDDLSQYLNKQYDPPRYYSYHTKFVPHGDIMSDNEYDATVKKDNSDKTDIYHLKSVVPQHTDELSSLYTDSSAELLAGVLYSQESPERVLYIGGWGASIPKYIAQRFYSDVEIIDSDSISQAVSRQYSEPIYNNIRLENPQPDHPFDLIYDITLSKLENNNIEESEVLKKQQLYSQSLLSYHEARERMKNSARVYSIPSAVDTQGHLLGLQAQSYFDVGLRHYARIKLAKKHFDEVNEAFFTTQKHLISVLSKLGLHGASERLNLVISDPTRSLRGGNSIDNDSSQLTKEMLFHVVGTAMDDLLDQIDQQRGVKLSPQDELMKQNKRMYLPYLVEYTIKRKITALETKIPQDIHWPQPHEITESLLRSIIRKLPLQQYTISKIRQLLLSHQNGNVWDHDDLSFEQWVELLQAIEMAYKLEHPDNDIYPFVNAYNTADIIANVPVPDSVTGGADMVERQRAMLSPKPDVVAAAFKVGTKLDWTLPKMDRTQLALTEGAILRYKALLKDVTSFEIFIRGLVQKSTRDEMQMKAIDSLETDIVSSLFVPIKGYDVIIHDTINEYLTQQDIRLMSRSLTQHCNDGITRHGTLVTRLTLAPRTSNMAEDDVPDHTFDGTVADPAQVVSWMSQTFSHVYWTMPSDGHMIVAATSASLYADKQDHPVSSDRSIDVAVKLLEAGAITIDVVPKAENFKYFGTTSNQFFDALKMKPTTVAQTM